MNSERLIINEFIRQLNKSRSLNLVITQWPDEINRTTKDIDAIAEYKDTKIAIEHTSIDVLPKQRFDDSRFYPVVKGLSDELINKFNCRLTIVIPSNSIPKGYNFEELRQKLKKWLLANVPILPIGKTTIKNEEIPFQFYIRKEESDNHKVSIGRDVPFDSTFESRLSTILARKSDKLQKYGQEGFKTIILVENYDIQLMSEDKIFNAIHYNNSIFSKNSVCEIWYGDSSIKDDLQFWLLYNRNYNAEIHYPILLKY